MLWLHAALLSLEDGSASFYRDAIISPNDDNTTAIAVNLSSYAETTGARCLDGTPAVYYFRKGVGSGANKWYIHHQGGGWCESWDDCLGRSKGGLGSSHGYPPSMSMVNGYFDARPSINPMMYNWNMVLMRYCDGGSFSGNNETVATYNGTKLYYRGKRIREAVFDSLKTEHNIGKATDAVISGCSAGGLATFLHTDQWCDSLQKDAKVKCVGMPDSGFFLDYQDPRYAGGGLRNTPGGTYHSGLKWVFTTMNASAGVNQDCVKAHATGPPHDPDTPSYLCMFAEHTSPFTHTPLFPLQSEYDSWQTGHVLYYPNTAKDVQVLGNNLTKRITADLFGPHPQSGAFLDSCWHHCGAWDQIRIDGELVSTAFAKWYDGLGPAGEAKPSKRIWKQGKPYMCDACCKP